MASIRELDPIVASRIAAGEVVERPASVLRELLDNAIDAKATKISVYLEQGGIRNLTVIDNGCGMSAEDLVLACKSHATSKVRTLEDLFNLKTLGFRGEALSSIAACSLLTINSNGNRIVIDNGVQSPVMPGSVTSGTSVSMEFLFENIPARKLFLKRPQSEATECRKTFIEKALGFEDIEFLLFVEGELKLHFERSDKKERAVKVMATDKAFMPAQVLQMTYKGENLALYAISSDPSCYRRDRTQIRLFVNNRVIDSYQLVQAITSAYSAAIPGGAFPYFYLFIEDNPSLVDFNIHPAKRECKLRNQSQIYGSITTMIRQALVNKTYDTDDRREAEPMSSLFEEPQKQEKPQQTKPSALSSTTMPEPHKASETAAERPPVAYGSQHSSQAAKPSAKPFDPSWFENAKAIMKKEPTPSAKPVSTPKTPEVETPTVASEYTYIGQVFNTFLMVQTPTELLFIDQHALHERILYDEIRAQRDVQRLIVPYEFEVERSVDDYLQQNSMLYADFGIELTRKEPLLWEMASMPATVRKNEKEIVSYIQNMTGDIESAQKGLFAIIACHAAIKAGDELDSVTAKALVKKAFELDRMVCPHGRSFTYIISKEQLYKDVGRIV
ncbi:MAG: DNA mismatch repair endonuclease MutL [Sphaerochaetaceae bacterium]|nr:DNA mismatch repair endonuclease MutL [Sphaerochaetaceae bacterium]